METAERMEHEIMRTEYKVWMLGAMAAVLVSVAAAQTSAVKMGEAKMGEAKAVLPTGLGEAVDRDVMTIREVTEKFKATEAAEAAGYKRNTGCVEHQPAGAMGYHFNNEALLDATLDLKHPEVLVYEKMPDGTFQLNGVEFYVPKSAWKSSDPPRIMGQDLQTAPSLDFWYLHVWVWKADPSGLFAPWNPDVKCSEPSAMSH